MKHGYTNSTDHHGAVVRKEYRGPDAELRQDAEVRALTTLRTHLAVPEIVSTGEGWLETEFVVGSHGQDLLDAGHAEAVLRECGRVLRRLYHLDPTLLDPAAGKNDVIQHGDFGPNNVLFATGSNAAPSGDCLRAIAVLDWEFSGVGDPIVDVAWCEWIVRMHHPDAVGHLGAFFEAYGSTPSWSDRQAEMVRRCRELTEFTRRWDPNGPAVDTWLRRTSTVESWRP